MRARTQNHAAVWDLAPVSCCAWNPAWSIPGLCASVPDTVFNVGVAAAVSKMVLADLQAKPLLGIALHPEAPTPASPRAAIAHPIRFPHYYVGSVSQNYERKMS